jgi:single-strand DNA-binding protein
MAAQGYNKAFLLGTIDADPELRYTTGGTAKLNLRIATIERYKTKDGVWTDKTSWHTVAVWGNRAEGLAKIVKRNEMIFVDGSLRTDRYEKDGSTRYFTYVNANHVSLCGGSGRPWHQENQRNEQQSQQQQVPEPEAKNTEDDDFGENGVPF